MKNIVSYEAHSEFNNNLKEKSIRKILIKIKNQIKMIIIGYVNYNCSDSINSSIISVGDNAMCVVCDNSGNYNNIYNVKVVCPKSNIGLYNGFNYIIKSLSKINYNWFLASNPDIEYNYDFFNQLKKNTK